ncbi:amino acid permease [Erysipelothrix piscisicarius]|uniref:Amino acid permease n=1 Tax=Erysipelothrix piscisicarius TaxID=2485784 RepID=A0A3S5HK70_9FIRM|nr:amino acid permease [Erysipelothrix piscisicarius]AZK43840.1 amino acid permease [Erysipelothrix piscisicarius]
MLEVLFEVVIGCIAIFYVDAKEWSDTKKQVVAMLIYWILIALMIGSLIFFFGA